VSATAAALILLIFIDDSFIVSARCSAGSLSTPYQPQGRLEDLARTPQHRVAASSRTEKVPNDEGRHLPAHVR